MRSSSGVLPFLFLTGALACATRGPGAHHAEPQGEVLPLRAVRLYEGGIGYFERAGRLGEAGARLPVPASHVDDALKSLVVLGEGQANLSGLEFATLLSRGRALSLASLPQRADGNVGYGDVLRSLEGTAVLIRLADEELKGALLDVERLTAVAPEEGEQEPPDSAEPPRYLLTVLGENGAVRRIDGDRVIDLSPLDETVRHRLSVAAVALSDRAAQLERDLHVVAASSQPVRVGYVAEAPVWRSSYRLIRAADGHPARLQGWALIHNDTDEPWRGVQIQLVNGLPDSYLHPLAAPRYSARPLAEPSEPLSTVPQLAERTPDGIWGDHVPWEEQYGESYGAGGLGLSGVGAGGGGRGQGVGLGSIGLVEGRTATSDRITLGNLAEIAPAQGTEEAALFSYTLPEALDLRAHGSTLVPFVDVSLEGERVTWFAGPGPGRTALALQNTSRQTLPTGMVTVFEAPGFVGEGVLPRLKPGQSAFIEYGTDLDLELRRERQRRTEQPVEVFFVDGGLERHYLETIEERVVIENDSGEARTVQLHLGVPDNSKVSGQDTLTYDAERGGAVAVFQAKPASRREATLQTITARKRGTPLDVLTRDELAELSAAESVPEATRQVLGRALQQFEPVARSQAELERLKEERTVLSNQQETWYGHQRELGEQGDEKEPDPIRSRIVQLADRIDEIDAKIRAAEARRAQELRAVESELAVLVPPGVVSRP